jgi:hypothetical protein
MFEQGTGVVEEGVSDGRMLGLCYDPERLIVEGIYQDEVTAYRARKRWIETLRHNFLLEDAHDFVMKVKRVSGGRYFRVRCDFITACGRYAFWRLTHHQAPEVQMVLETAHLPHCNSNLKPEWLSQDQDDSECYELDAGGEPEPSTAPPQLTKQGGRSEKASWALRRIQALANKIFLLTKSGSKMR